MSWKEIYAYWNPRHGCTKVSPGCRHCYVYRQDEMYGSEKSSSTVKLNADFLKRDKSYKIPSGMMANAIAYVANFKSHRQTRRVSITE